MYRRPLMIGLLAAAAMGWACASEHVTGPGAGQGMLALKLTDAPLPLDSVAEVNVFIERIDARRARTDSAMHDMDIDDEHEEQHEHPDSTVWVTVATPNAAFNLLDLQNGVTAFLGSTPLDTGSFRGLRIIIDPAKSTIVLKDGTVLSSTSVPPVEFESSRRHGLMVELNDSLDVTEGDTTTVTLDLRLNVSLTLRGRTVHDGFLFRPVVVGSCERRRHDDN